MPNTTLHQEHAYLKFGGAENAELQADILELVVETSLQLPDMAVLTLHDTKLKWADAKTLDPGTEVEISVK
ncbi:MAG: type IV secretion protein Rhs, partial [Gemmatimonadaceae bacterium]